MTRLVLTALSNEIERFDKQSNVTCSVVRADNGEPVLGLRKENFAVAFIGQTAEVTYINDYGFGFYYVDVDWESLLSQGWTAVGKRAIMLMVREFGPAGKGGSQGPVLSAGRMVLPLTIV